MRKFMILFVCSILCVLSGLGIFGLELSKIKENTHYIHGNEVTYATTLSNRASQVALTANYSNNLYEGCDFNLSEDQLNFSDVKEDTSLDPNAIEITYSDALDIQKSHNGNDPHFLAIHFKMKDNEKNYTKQHLLNAIVKSWKNKELNYEEIAQKDKVVKIRYGSNLKDKIKIHQGRTYNV